VIFFSPVYIFSFDIPKDSHENIYPYPIVQIVMLIFWET